MKKLDALNQVKECHKTFDVPVTFDQSNFFA